MNENKMIFALAGFVLVVAAAIPAQADPPQDGDCPPGWGDPIRVNDAIDAEQAKDLDKEGNHDQWICENASSGDPHYKDNDKN